MIVAVTGANGFVGRTLVGLLLADAPGTRVRALVSMRPGAARELPAGDIDVRAVDVRDAATLRGALDGADAVVHTVAVPTERHARFADVNIRGVANVVGEAERAGVQRFVHLSSVGASTWAPWPYLRSKGEGQAIVLRSRIAHAVLRSSLLFGEGDDFFPRLAFSLAFPIVPVPGDGQARFQPLHVADLALALRTAVQDRGISGVHEVGGPEVVTYDGLVAETMAALGHQRPTVHIPVALVKSGAWVMGLVMSDPPVTVGQLDLLAVDNTPADNAIERVFGVHPRSIHGALVYLKKHGTTKEKREN